MNKLFSGILGALLLGGSARALPPWTQAQSAWEEIAQAQALARQARESRRSSPDAAALALIAQRLDDATERLVRADRENPRTRRTEGEMQLNPYAAAPGDNGKVDVREAQATQDPLAISFYDAVSTFLGSLYLEGGGREGFVEKVSPAYEVGLGDIRLFAQNMEQILARLDTDGSGTLDDVEMSRLPEGIAAYNKEKFPGMSPASARLSPLAWRKIEAVLRGAYAAALLPAR